MLEAVVAIDARDLVGRPDLDIDEYELEIVNRAYRLLLSASLAGLDGTLSEPYVRFELPDEIIICPNSS